MKPNKPASNLGSYERSAALSTRSGWKERKSSSQQAAYVGSAYGAQGAHTGFRVIHRPPDTAGPYG